MTLLSFIKKIFAPTLWLDDKIDRISHRVDELRKQTQEKPIKAEPLETPTFEIEAKSKAKGLNTFEPRPFEVITTMRFLKDKRIELEKKRIEDLRRQVRQNLLTIKNLINKEESDKAGSLLVDTYSAIKELNDGEILETYANIFNEITALKESIRQKEIERKRIEKEKEEETRRRSEAAEKERIAKLEQERLRKEREVLEYEELLRTEAPKRELERKRLLETVTCKKSDADKFLDYLRCKGINCFYHFTDVQNLASIRIHGGLYSWFYCKNNNISIPNAGGSSDSRILDCRHGLQDYVHLSFCSDHPMQYRLQCDGAKLVLLKIKVDVAAFKDTQFSNMNAASNAVQHGATFEDLERVNIYAVKQKFVSKTDDIFHEHQAECMVKTFIPLEYIINIDNPQRL